MALFPAIAESFGGSSLGLFYAMPALGAMAVTMTSGWTSRINRAWPGSNDCRNGMGIGDNLFWIGWQIMDGFILFSSGGSRRLRQRIISNDHLESNDSRSFAWTIGEH